MGRSSDDRGSGRDAGAPGARTAGVVSADDAASLPHLRLSHPAGGSVLLYRQGAHVATWTGPDGTDILFMSRLARLEEGVPIRGGIPIIFPQFSNRGPLPKHGFARTEPWNLIESGADSSGAARVHLELRDDVRSRELWPHAFRAEFIALLDRDLSTTLRVTNTGDAPFEFTSALHTYYQVEDVRRVAVRGLEGSTYLGVAADDEERPAPAALRIAAETDGVYAGVARRLRIVCDGTGRTVTLDTEGFADAVVWNPWIELAREIPDLAADEYLRMLCVEPANIASPTRLEPGQTWSGTQRISVAAGG